MDVPGYAILNTLGDGGRFALLRARRATDGRAILLKAPTSRPARAFDLEALEREFEILRELAVDGAPAVVELNRHGERPVLVVEDRGLDLVSGRMARGALPIEWVLAVAGHICETLHELHEKNIVLGSISPAGLLAGPDGQVQIADFSSASRTSTDGVLPVLASEPTPYTSPEQTGRINRVVDYRTDFYSLGISLYELLTGRPPYVSNEPLELIHFHLAKTPVAPSAIRPDVPEQVSRIVLRLLAKNPEDRYQSALGIRHDLERCAHEWRAGGTVTAFDLGSQDVSNRVVIPQRLYGRDREVATLTRAFDDVCMGRTAVVLVSGYSGVGKTSLIAGLYRPIVRQRGYFISGKFDQVVRNIPYGALAQAFRGLVWQLLAETDERLSEWRARIAGALGANGGVLAEVIPEIELIIGKQPPPPPLDPTESQNRFRYAFQSLASAMARSEHPLVVFLDDLQWVDAATLEILHALATSGEIAHLLLIGAYRDNEVDASHPLTAAVARLEASGALVHRVLLAPLGAPDLLAFLSDTLRSDTQQMAPLARLILEKTDGNPFFVIQFLKMLAQDRLLIFDQASGGWSFRIDAIERAGLTDNVIDLMTRKIQRLSPRAQSALTLAACIGSEFEWSTFLAVSRQAPDEIAAGLAEAVDAGLVQRSQDRYDTSHPDNTARVVYSFLHDRVQQAAYDLIPKERRQAVHLDVGRLLLVTTGGDVPEERLFEIVNHLNIGSSGIASEDERRTVVRLNLAAGRKAKTSAAFRSAATHLEQGLELSRNFDWRTDYELLFQLHQEAAECLYLAGESDRAEASFLLLLEHAATERDRAGVHALRITMYAHQSRWDDALRAGQEALGPLGVTFPDSTDDQQTALDREVGTIQGLLGSRPIASLVALPIATDPSIRMVMRILTSLWAPAYISGNQLLTRLISATMVRLSLSHGNTEDSPYGYVTHAITIGPIRMDYAAAYEWGQLALAVQERSGDPRRRAKIYQQFHAHVNFWRRPYDTCIPFAREARRSGLEIGDFTYAGYGAASEAWPAFVASRSLVQYVRDYTPTLALLNGLKMAGFHAATRIMLNWAAALQGRTASRFSLSDASFDEAAFAATYERQSPFFLTFLYAAKLHLGLLFQDFAMAVAAWRSARRVAVEGTIWPAIVDGWGSLALAGITRDVGTGPDWVELEAVRRRLAVLAENCPQNFRAQWLLLSGEMERRREQHRDAVPYFEQAIEYAREAGSVQQEALANEMCARSLIEAGDDRTATARLVEAHRCYSEWGASAKVRDLEERYERLLGQHVGAADSRRWTSPETSGDGEAASVDMLTVLKLARAIAVEIHLDDLLRKVMTIAIENAGAKRGVFLAARDSGLTVEAEATVDSEQGVRLGSVPVESSDAVPQSVVQYVRRTTQDVVVGDAPADERFGADPYVLRTQPRSILCVPVSHQGRLGGILYLENDLTANAFTPGRTEMMRILAAQAAISLENARLYAEMKAEVNRRAEAEQSLRVAVGELEELKNRLQAENVYLQEEIGTQHNFNEIVGNSPVLVAALRQVERVAPTESTVLIAGETGAGKELFARAVHSRSRRRNRPLVKVNCGAIAPGLIESELFGHVKGAFTGAIDARIGRFEVANGGTILLDEVGELPLDAQVKLLRVLQEREFEPVGSSRTVRVDVRVIAATNRKLEDAVREGAFRADLFYRLNVFPIRVPPLRERREDVPLLVALFLSGLAKRLGKRLDGFTARSMERLQAYEWPGNVRELQNVVERAAILSPSQIVDLQSDLLPASPAPGVLEAVQTLEDIERAHILRVVRQTNWTIEGQRGAATILGMHPNTLRSRMKKLGIARTSH